MVQDRYLSSDGKNRYYSVHGHAYSDRMCDTGLVNFAVLRSVLFTEPIASGQDYTEYLAMLTGGGHPVMQCVGGFRSGKRTTKAFRDGDLYDFSPILPQAMPGDISPAMPSKFLSSIWKARKCLDAIVPAVLHPAAVLYYPEIKLYANKSPLKNGHFMKADTMYLIGDGAGPSLGMTAFWASGMRAEGGFSCA